MYFKQQFRFLVKKTLCNFFFKDCNKSSRVNTKEIQFIFSKFINNTMFYSLVKQTISSVVKHLIQTEKNN